MGSDFELHQYSMKNEARENLPLQSVVKRHIS